MRHKNELVDIACELRKETDLAWLIFDGAKEAWVPKRECELVRNVANATYECTMPTWMAKAKGLI